jgi:orotidine-5'-phosphate decarboxylase
MAEPDLREVGIDASPLMEAMRLAELAAACGLDGVVCSAHEAAAVRDRLGGGFLRITPGIRLPADGAGDQKRVMTPLLAIESGASYLVIGRSVTRAADPLAVLARINRDIAVAEAQ